MIYGQDFTEMVEEADEDLQEELEIQRQADADRRYDEMRDMEIEEAFRKSEGE